MDGDCFGGERGIEPVPQAEVVDGVRERIHGAREECEVGGMLQMGVQNPANESPVYYLQTDWHNKESLEQVPLKLFLVKSHKLPPDPPIIELLMESSQKKGGIYE